MEKHKKLFQRFEMLNQVWLTELDKYSDEQLQVKPNDSDWSIAQVYNHLFSTNKNYFKKQIESCINKNTYTLESKNWIARFILLLDMFPPTKYKMPKSLQNIPIESACREEFKKSFISVISEMKLLTEKLPAAHPYQRSKHPTFGMLNAEDWFQLMNIHMEHHLRQKKRIDHFLGV